VKKSPGPSSSATKKTSARDDLAVHGRVALLHHLPQVEALDAGVRTALRADEGRQGEREREQGRKLLHGVHP
jgi:hypothetical protein